MPTSTPEATHQLLATIEQLFQIQDADLDVALSRAADLVAAVLRADKVDVFVYQADRDSLVALGTSHQPLSSLQKEHGLDLLQVSNGGRVVDVYKSGRTFVTGRLDQDETELPGVKEALRVRSEIGVPFQVGGERRGVLLIASQTPDLFTAADVRFTESVAAWVGLVAQRSELLDEISRTALEAGRRAGAEELVTVLAHDLRNYLSPLELRLGFLRRRAERDSRAADLRDAELAARTVGRLSALVNDILDVARVDRGVFQMDLQPVDVAAVVEDAAATLATPEQPVEVEGTVSRVFVGDPARLRQCLENVVANAIKHSPRGTPVTARIGGEKRSGEDWIRIDVIDRGPGVPPEMLPRIFERFVTGEQREGGLGLGLYLAKRIAVMHGGDLRVESAPGHGARFTLTLPASAPARP